MSLVSLDQELPVERFLILAVWFYSAVLISFFFFPTIITLWGIYYKYFKSRLEVGPVLLDAVFHIASLSRSDFYIFPCEKAYDWGGQRTESVFQIVNICLDHKIFFGTHNF